MLNIHGKHAASAVGHVEKTNEYESLETTIRAVFHEGRRLLPGDLLEAARNMAFVDGVDLRHLYEDVKHHLGPWDRVNPELVLRRLAEQSGIDPLTKDKVSEILVANRPKYKRVAGVVQTDLDRIFRGEKLSAAEFETWKDAFLALPPLDRRHVAIQLFHHLGLKPAKQEEVALEMARRAGLPESAASDVPRYRTGQDLKVVLSLSARIGLPFVNVGVTAGAGVCVREKDLVTGYQPVELVAREGVSAGVVRGSAMQTTGKPHFVVGGGLTSPLAMGPGAGYDEVYGPIAVAKIGPLMNFFAGDSALGARLPLGVSAMAGSGWSLGIGVSEPRLETVTSPIRKAARSIGERFRETGQVMVAARMTGVEAFRARCASLARSAGQPTLEPSKA